MDEKTMSSETLSTVIMIELVNDRKKFIFVRACSKLSHEILEGNESGLAKMSGFNFSEFTKTRKNGVTYAKARIEPTANVMRFAKRARVFIAAPHIFWILSLGLGRQVPPSRT